MEALSFRRSTSVGMPGFLGKAIESKAGDLIGFAGPLVGLGLMGWVFTVSWQYGSAFTTQFVATSLLIFILVGFTSLNMGHLVLAHQGNLLMRSLPLPKGSFARAKLFVLFLFGTAWSLAFNIPGVWHQIQGDLGGVSFGMEELLRSVGTLVTLLLSSALLAAFVQSLTVLLYRGVWTFKPLRPHISSLLSLVMVLVLALFVVWSSTGHTNLTTLHLNTEPNSLTWFLPPSWFASLGELASGRGGLPHLFSALAGLGATALLLPTALNSLGGLLSSSSKTTPVRKRRLWGRSKGVKGALGFLLWRHMWGEERIRGIVPPLLIVTILPLLMGWFRPGEMSHILSPQTQVTWSIDLFVGLAVVITAIGILAGTTLLHSLRYAENGDGGLRFATLPLAPNAPHLAATRLVSHLYIIPVTILYALTLHFIVNGWGRGGVHIAMGSPFAVTLAQVAAFPLDCLLVMRLDALMNPAQPLSQPPEEAEVYPAWLSIGVPAVGLGMLAGVSYRLMRMNAGSYWGIGWGITLLKLAIYLYLGTLEKKRLASTR